ncbi:MAG: hypothetical protein KAS11_00285 [Candidatus Aenigmarchaeota archaeon]|nr:hypothetical protein [Candidatus Aenigmarchaeota archaeon]
MANNKEGLLKNPYLKKFFDEIKKKGSIKSDKYSDREQNELKKFKNAGLIKFRKKTNDYVLNNKKLKSSAKQAIKKQKTDDCKHGRGQCYYLIINRNIDSTEWIKFLDHMNFDTRESIKRDIESIKIIDNKYRLHIELWSKKTYSVHFENYLDHTGYKSERAKNELMKFKKRIEDEFADAEIQFVNKSKPTKEINRLKRITEPFMKEIPEKKN